MGRAPCCSKDAGLNRGAWTAEEDSILNKYISIHGDNGGWKYLPPKAGLRRCGKSCRLRWLNYLRPGIKRGNISADEEDLIIRMHKLLGNRWSLIAGRLPGRTDSEIKNYWNTQLVKKIESKEYCVPTAKEICTTSKYQSDCSEDHQLLRTAAIRTTAVRLPKNPYKENANIISRHREIKLQREASEIVDDLLASCCSQSSGDEQIKGSDFDQIVDYSSAQNTIELENHGIEIIGEDFPTFWSSLIANQFPDCDPNDREHEFNTCNSSLDLNEMRLPEDNFPWSPYNFITEEWINESQYLQI